MAELKIWYEATLFYLVDYSPEKSLNVTRQEDNASRVRKWVTLVTLQIYQGDFRSTLAEKPWIFTINLQPHLLFTLAALRLLQIFLALPFPTQTNIDV